MSELTPGELETARHTKGPWLAAAKPSSIVGWPIVGPGGRMICAMSLAHKPEGISEDEWSAHYGEVEANAKLIASAPSLAAERDAAIARAVAAEAESAEALVMTGCRDQADLIDMANVGKGLLERIHELRECAGPFKNWTPADDPCEIVVDLSNALDDALENYGGAESDAKSWEERAEAAEHDLAAVREGLERERLARIIDPSAFDNGHVGDAERAFTKADAIRALLPTPSQPSTDDARTCDHAEAYLQYVKGQPEEFCPDCRASKALCAPSWPTDSAKAGDEG